jgi:DNA-binding Lrp family transcriptional regulator
LTVGRFLLGAGVNNYRNQKGYIMVTSIILIKAERASINSIAEQLVELGGISEVYSVSGKYDLIAISRLKTNDELAGLVTDRMRGIEGIVNTETMLAFKAYSRHDLEAMFSLGM